MHTISCHDNEGVMLVLYTPLQVLPIIFLITYFQCALRLLDPSCIYIFIDPVFVHKYTSKQAPTHSYTQHDTFLS